MIDQISRLVHEGGQAKVIEVIHWEDRPDSPMVTPETKHWVSVGIGDALAKRHPTPPEEERRIIDSLAGFKQELVNLGFKFEDIDNQYFCVVTGQTRSDREIIDFDPCGGDDCQIHCQTVKIVKTRKEHQCLGVGGPESMHVMPPGTRARFDKALVEGQWGSYYVCAECIEKYMASEGI